MISLRLYSRLRLLLILHWKLVHIYLAERKLLVNSQQERKMIRHHTHLQENSNLRKAAIFEKRNAIMGNDIPCDAEALTPSEAEVGKIRAADDIGPAEAVASVLEADGVAWLLL